MSTIATESIWRVEINEGDGWWGGRNGAWLFSNRRAAKAFIKVAEKTLLPGIEVELTELDAYKTSQAALFQSWPFSELKEYAEVRR